MRKTFDRHIRLLLGIILVAAGSPAALLAISFGGELRVRPEYRDNPDFNKDTTDTQSFIGSRIRLSVNQKALDDVLVKITLQDSRFFGGEPAATGASGLTDSGEAVDIHEGYVDLLNFMKLPVSLRVGRQELVYGDQRLIGHFGWNNAGRAFDAFKLIYNTGDYGLDAWMAKRKENNSTVGTPNADRDFYGLYGSLKALIPWTVLDFYTLLDREGDNSATAARKKTVVTVGTRFAGKVSAVDYTLELPYQFGDNGTRTTAGEDVKIHAYAFAGKAGYTFAGPHAVRLGAEYDYASGDDNSSDATSRTFSNLYPTNHLFYGYMDYQGWRNTMIINGNVSASFLEKKLFVQGLFRNYRLADGKDSWYAADGTAASTVRAVSAASKGQTDVGNEVDLLLRYDYNMQVTFEAGWSYFLRGSFIKEKIANSGNSDWAYAQMTVKF